MKPSDRREWLLRKHPERLTTFLIVVMGIHPFSEGEWL